MEVFPLLLQLAEASCTYPEAKTKYDEYLVRLRPLLSKRQLKKLELAATGYAGLVYTTKSSATGTRTEAYLTKDFTSEEEALEGKYTVVCSDHSTCVLVDTLEMARYQCAHPYGFCDDCREAQRQK